MIKTLYIEKESIAEAWLEAVWNVFLYGTDIKTQYDKEGDYPSKDSTTMIVVRNPFSNPLKSYQKMNKMDIYCHEGDLIGIHSVLGGYLDEITKGTHDDEIGKGESFPYTYHDRICGYPNYVSKNINQIEGIIKILKDAPYSRRAQGITWQPNIDLGSIEPPCLQRIWCRVIDNELTFQTEWRSRDLFKAWGANVNGMVQWMKIIADALSVKCGTYVDFANSLHIYGMKKEFDAVVTFFDTIIKKATKNNTLDQIPAQYLKDFEKFKQDHQY